MGWGLKKSWLRNEIKEGPNKGPNGETNQGAADDASRRPTSPNDMRPRYAAEVYPSLLVWQDNATGWTIDVAASVQRFFPPSSSSFLSFHIFPFSTLFTFIITKVTRSNKCGISGRSLLYDTWYPPSIAHPLECFIPIQNYKRYERIIQTELKL